MSLLSSPFSVFYTSLLSLSAIPLFSLCLLYLSPLLIPEGNKGPSREHAAGAGASTGDGGCARAHGGAAPEVREREEREACLTLQQGSIHRLR